MARKGKVAVIGAGFYGSTTAQRLAEYDIFDEVVLTDIVEGKPEGLALDMSQSRPIEGSTGWMMMRQEPASEAVAIEIPKAQRFPRVGFTAMSRSARLSCETARMARPKNVRDI